MSFKKVINGKSEVILEEVTPKLLANRMAVTLFEVEDEKTIQKIIQQSQYMLDDLENSKKIFIVRSNCQEGECAITSFLNYDFRVIVKEDQEIFIILPDDKYLRPVPELDTIKLYIEYSPDDLDTEWEYSIEYETFQGLLGAILETLDN